MLTFTQPFVSVKVLFYFSLSRETRRKITERTRDGCSPLFLACKKGNVEAVEYLLTVCDANIEQEGLYEVPEGRSIHLVTPLWAASISNQLPIVKLLVRLGANINACSDSGSTPVRSACFMTNIDVVQFLVENGADIRKPNQNGGTCLINSVQSVQLCAYLISKGVDVNARDIQKKTALHYAIQEHRLETCKLLLDNGADPFAKSRYGDDCLLTACLKGTHQIFDYLKSRIEYSNERLANAHELIGATFLDEHNETRIAILHWRTAFHLRQNESNKVVKLPKVPSLRPAYLYHREFTSIEELENIATDVDAMRIQSLLIYERILGIQHKDTLFRLMFRGASYVDSLQFQRCIDLWLLVLQVRIEKYSILYSDTVFTAQAIVRLMLDILDKNLEIIPHEFDDMNLPRFKDVLHMFCLLADSIQPARDLLQIRPIYRKQQENFDRVLKCITHLLYLMISTAKTKEHTQSIHTAVRRLLLNDVRSSCTRDTLLHLTTSRLNVIKSGYLSEDTQLRPIFPNVKVVRLLIQCGINVNLQNNSGSSPLLVASLPYNFDANLINLLLESGAHIDQPNKNADLPLTLIQSNPGNEIYIASYMSLKCLASSIIVKYRIPYKNVIPKTLEAFVKCHEP